MREPFAAHDLHRFLALHVVRGVEAAGPGWYERACGCRTATAPSGSTSAPTARPDRWCAPSPSPTPATSPRPPSAPVGWSTSTATPSRSTRRWARTGALAGLVAATPGLRVPGQLDGFEVAVQTVLGQQVSLASARAACTRLVAEHGEPLALTGDLAVSRLFPTAADLAAVDPAALAMPRVRARALTTMAAAIEAGEVRLDRSTDRASTREALLALPGIGPWTADCVAIRALGDPDVFLPTDLGVRNAATRLGLDDVVRRSESWRPWRSYALMRLWAVVPAGMPLPENDRPGGELP